MNTTLNASPLAITSINHWKDHVAKMKNAEELNAGMAFLYQGERVKVGLHPFKQQNKMGYAYKILHDHALSLPVNRYSFGYRDQ